MADDNDKPTLTRRRVLGGMATIGAAGAVGAGTWAQMQDTESFGNTVEAGVLDLKVDGDGNSFPLLYGPVQNGEPNQRYGKNILIQNTGNIEGRYLGVKITNVQNNENGVEEPERDLGDDNSSGELLDYVEVVSSLRNPDSNNEGGDPDVLDRGPVTEGREQINDLFDPEYLSMNPDDQGALSVEIITPDENMSDAMSDVVKFDLELTLYDEQPDGSTTQPPQ